MNWENLSFCDPEDRNCEPLMAMYDSYCIQKVLELWVKNVTAISVNKRCCAYQVINQLQTPSETTTPSHTGYWPQIAEVHIKGIISMSPDACIFSLHRKALPLLSRFSRVRLCATP